MRVVTKCLGSILAIGIILVSAVVLAPIAFADKPSPDVFSPDSTVFGKKYNEWSTEWWQYVLSFPTSENPLLDTTGERCLVGQHGPVWFLVGTFGASTATRNCSIPEGETLFFPVINNVNINTPNVCGQGPDNIPLTDLRSFSAPLINDATNLLVTVDGNPVKDLQKRFRTRSVVFDVALPEDNVFDSPCMGAGLGNVPAGIYSPAVDDGFYVMLQPLSLGNHTLHIHAEAPDFGFSLDVTYNLTIVPVLLE